MSEENLTIENILAGFLASAIEGKSILDTYKELGIEKEDLNGNTPFAAYAKSLVDDETLKRENGTKLFLVKKIWCKSDIKEMEKSINSRETKKYDVVVAISADRESIGFTKDEPGIQAFLVRAKDKKEALSKAVNMKSLFGFSHTLFDAKAAKTIDDAIENALNVHTPESIHKFMDIFKTAFSQLTG